MTSSEDRMNKKRKSYISSCEISAIESVELGGYSQKIAVEGKSKESPIVICLHGGPGSPVPFSVGCRGLFPDITDRLIMVYWDQLGCGINNYKIDNGFTIEHFVKMTVDLIREIRARFRENKLYLFGMSWGSILALRAAVQVPDLIDGVVTCGQVVTAPMLSDSAFDAIEASSAPAKKKSFARDLRSRRTSLSLKEMTALSQMIRKYTDGYNNHSSKSAPVGDIIKGLLSSPDYRFKDFVAIVKNGYAKNESLMREMATADFSDTFKDVTVPYHIFQGETDIVTSTKDVITLLDGLRNENVSYTVLPNVGHFPSESAMQEIYEKIYQLAFSSLSRKFLV